MNSNYLKIVLKPDDDGTCELFAEVTANGFSGKSSAWFNIQEIVDFSNKLTTYPFPPEFIPQIEGGYWSNSIQGKLEQTHLSIKVYSVGNTGNLGVRIRLATPLSETDRIESQHVVEVEIQTSYNQLEAFSNRLSQLATFGECEAILIGGSA